MRPDNDDNWQLYGKGVTHRAILAGEVPPPAETRLPYLALDRHVPARTARAAD